MSGTHWKESELNLLKECNGKELKEILNLFPNRTKNSIESKGNKIGIKFKRATFLLNSDQIEKFKMLYPDLKVKQLQKHFNLSKRQIELLAYRMGLKKKDDKEFIICTSCNKILLNTNEFFYDFSETIQCKNCIKKKQRINEYKRKYDIVLNFNSMYDTYTIEEWHEFMFKTPNGNTISQLPINIHTEENLVKIIRYCFIKHQLMDRNELLNTSKDFILKNKINFKLNGKKLTLYDCISMAFPEFNIKPWEISTLPPNYFKDEENIYKALEWLVEKLDIDDSDVLNGYINSKILRNYGLRMIAEYFDSVLEIIIFYFKRKFNREVDERYIMKHRNLLSIDGINHFDSIEERIVFDFIKFNMGIESIQYVKRDNKNNRLYNEKYDEYYYPDFKIQLNNKNIIIEYYGMYTENPTHDTYVEYKNKTIRKNEYYNSLPNVLFVDIYPNDLNNKFNGLKMKVESALRY